MLTLERARHPKQKQNADWQRRERAYGSFSRAVQLPFRIDPDKVEGRSHNGILEIKLQRLEGGPVEKIEIRLGWVYQKESVTAREVRTVDQTVSNGRKRSAISP